MKTDYYTAGKHGYMLYADDKFADFVFERIAPRLAGREMKGAVELGAGMGRFSGPLVRNYPGIALVEPAEDFVSVLRERFGGTGAGIHHQDISGFFGQAPSRGPELLFCFHLLHHLSEKDRRLLFSVAAEKGHRLVIVEPNHLNPLFLIQLLVTPDMRWAEEKEYLRMTRKYFVETAAASGLKVSVYENFCFFPPFLTDRILQIGRWTKKALELFEPLSVLFAGSYRLIVVEK